MESGLEERAVERRIRIHEPFAEFLRAKPALCGFEVSLLDCYRLAGHACHAITGAFLVTEKAVKNLFPETGVCERGDLAVEFGSALHEYATGPRSNVISFITGAWAESGFPGLKGNFGRKNLVTYGVSEIPLKAVRFRRLSNGDSVTVEYSPSVVTGEIKEPLVFPESWRVEICAILDASEKAIQIINRTSR